MKKNELKEEINNYRRFFNVHLKEFNRARNLRNDCIVTGVLDDLDVYQDLMLYHSDKMDLYFKLIDVDVRYLEALKLEFGE